MWKYMIITILVWEDVKTANKKRPIGYFHSSSPFAEFKKALLEVQGLSFFGPNWIHHRLYFENKKAVIKGTQRIGVILYLDLFCFSEPRSASFYLPESFFPLPSWWILVSSPNSSIFFSHKLSHFHLEESGWIWCLTCHFRLCEFGQINWPLWASFLHLSIEEYQLYPYIPSNNFSPLEM